MTFFFKFNGCKNSLIFVKKQNFQKIKKPPFADGFPNLKQ